MIDKHSRRIGTVFPNFASKISALNIPEADIMRMEGWETDYVMKSVYRHAMEDKNKAAQRDAVRKLSGAILD